MWVEVDQRKKTKGFSGATFGEGLDKECAYCFLGSSGDCGTYISYLPSARIWCALSSLLAYGFGYFYNWNPGFRGAV